GRGNVRKAKQKRAPQTSALHPIKKRRDRVPAEHDETAASLADDKKMTTRDRNPTDQATTAFPMPRWLSACIVTGTFLTLAILERRRPLRRTVEPGLQRTGRNLAIATLGAIAIDLAETPIVARAAAMVEHR